MDRFKRREIILESMQKLKSSEINCQGCDGHCCSFKSNSMQITPLETLELYTFLQEQNRWNEELIATLQACINDYRLDKEISTGKNTTFRRTYTCPFYTPGPKGCSIEPKSKPYGCLAFNPSVKGAQGEGCESEIDILEQRENKFLSYELEQNQSLKEKYGLWWEKLPIPVALIELNKRINK